MGLAICKGSMAPPPGFAAMQKGGQGIARRRDAALHQNAPDRPL